MSGVRLYKVYFELPFSQRPTQSLVMYTWELTPRLLYLTNLLCVALEKDTLKGPPLVSENPKLEKQAPREVKASGGRPDGGTKSVPGTPPTQSGAVTPNKCRSPTCVVQVNTKCDNSQELTTRVAHNRQCPHMDQQ